MTQTRFTREQTGTIIGGRALLVVSLALGFIIVPIMARAFPVFVNGFLTLVLVGTLLLNYRRWLPYLAAFETTEAQRKAPRPAITPGQEAPTRPVSGGTRF